MAYNLQPLITTLQQILNPNQTRWTLHHNKPLLESLLQKSTSLQNILQKSSLSKKEDLEIQIREAAHEAEDMIESHMVDEMLSGSEGTTTTRSLAFVAPDGLHRVARKLDHLLQEMAIKLEEAGGESMWRSSSSSSGSGGGNSSHDPSSKSIVVGVDEDLMQLRDRLTGAQSKLEVVPIVGMGGIGKTTLARKLYQDPSVVSRFGSRAWATISQDFDMKAILSTLVRCITGEDRVDEDCDSSRDALYKSLYGRRYMIVLDDVWNIKFWDEIRTYFPNNNNGSRIMITTRGSEVASHAASKSPQHQVQLLSKSESWNLLRQLVFKEQGKCPDFLEETGRKIANDCGGLPLAISVIGGALSKIKRSKEEWENVANDVRAAIVESGNEQFSKILSLSYNHLPNHLKPCFLYVGAFPEDYEIKAYKLVRMYVAEGFLRTNGDDKSSEKEAEDCLEALVERNLLSVERKKSDGKVLSYRIHDLLRDLCMRKGDEEKFLRVVVENSVEAGFSSQRRVCVHACYGLKEGWLAAAESTSLIRSFLAIYDLELHSPLFLSTVFSALRLVRVLDVIETTFDHFPMEVFELFNLRYLAFSCNSSIPRGVSRLWNLKILVAKLAMFDGQESPLVSPETWETSEIWEMAELRHLELNGVLVIEDDECMEAFVQRKLTTIYSLRLTPSLQRKSFFRSIPNITEMGIYCDSLPSIAVVDLSHLRKLKKLICSSSFVGSGRYFLGMLSFPPNLRTLDLYKCEALPEVLTAISALPHLEELTIRRCWFGRDEETGEEAWKVEEGHVFRSLRSLRLIDLSLVQWTADQSNFPRLWRLVVERCKMLKEIPIAMGELQTLEFMEVDDCGYYVGESAKRIQELQIDYGNSDFELHIRRTTSSSTRAMLNSVSF